MENMIEDFLESEEFIGALNAHHYAVSHSAKAVCFSAIKDMIRANYGQTWRPIDKAPKDSPVILFRPSASCLARVAVGEWCDKKLPKPYWGGRDKFVSVSEYRKWCPTHWMPLPDDPKEGT